jgi:hypothetical protein
MGSSQAAKENPITAAMAIAQSQRLCVAMLRIASKHFIVFFIKTILNNQKFILSKNKKEIFNIYTFGIRCF